MHSVLSKVLALACVLTAAVFVWLGATRWSGEIPGDRPAVRAPSPGAMDGDPNAPFRPLVAARDVEGIRAALATSREPGAIKAGLGALRKIDPKAARETATALARDSALEPSLKTSLQDWAGKTGKCSHGHGTAK